MSHLRSYSKLFAPPKFLERPSVAIEILPAGIYFLMLKNTDQGQIPDKSGFEPLPEGTISQGEIIKRDQVIKALINIRKKVNTSFIRFSIPEEKTYVFKTYLPKLSDREIREVLDFKIEENVPLAAKEAVFDYDFIPTSPNQSEELGLIVSVTPLKLVEDFQELFISAGFMPMMFRPESSNVAKAVVKQKNQQTIVIVNIKEENIIFSLAVSGIVCQTSSVNFGSSTFNNLLAKYFNVSLAEAIKIKKEKLYSDNPDNVEIFSYLINTISAIKDEIYKFISYCNEREDISEQVERVILCGRDAAIIGFEKYLALNLSLNVDIANVWVNNFELDSYIPNISHLDSLDLAVVNGLSLQ